MTDKQDKPIVTNVENRPCGCVVQHFSNNTQGIAPCVACGMAEIGRLHRQMGDMYGALAGTLRKQQERAVLHDVASAIANTPRKS